MSERYILDISTNSYLDRDRLLKGLAYDKKVHDDLAQPAQQREHPRRQEADEPLPPLRRDVHYLPNPTWRFSLPPDMFPGEELRQLRFCASRLSTGFLKTVMTSLHDEYKVLEHLPRLYNQAGANGQSRPDAEMRNGGRSDAWHPDARQ